MATCHAQTIPSFHALNFVWGEHCDCVINVASSPGSSQFINVSRFSILRVTLKNWEEPGDEAIINNVQRDKRMLNRPKIHNCAHHHYTLRL